MEVMEELKRMICTELEDIAKKGEMSPGDLEAVYKLIVAKEKLLRIDELEEKLGYSEDGRRWRYSRDGEPDCGRKGNDFGDLCKISVECTVHCGERSGDFHGLLW